MQNTHNDYSRIDLLRWVNDLLKTNYESIESLGDGAAYCQILDSIYGDVPMYRVKFDSMFEYERLNNYKILQNTFVTHKISKPIPVERLLKCRFQDNFEFLNFLRKHWDLQTGLEQYDPSSRRKQKTPTGGATQPKRSRSNSTIDVAKYFQESHSKPNSTRHSRSQSAATTPSGSRPSSRASSPKPVIISSQIQNLQEKVDQLNSELQTLEMERNFYYKKLREIETLSERYASMPNYMPMVKEIQGILYQLEDGFEIPESQVHSPF